MDLLIIAGAVLCVIAVAVAYSQYHDVFHATFLFAPMCAFIYVYMPWKLVQSGELYSFISEDQAIFVHSVILACLAALFYGCLRGSRPFAAAVRLPVTYDQRTIHISAYVLGTIGFLAWAWTIRSAGGFEAAYSQAKGGGWSDFGYVREASYLMIVGVILLLSPEGFAPKKKIWVVALLSFTLPWLIKGLLGARRGPTFVIIVTVAMSWYLARGKRPSLMTLAAGGFGLGMLMLFLVVNRSQIHLGSDMEFNTEVTESVSKAGAANEYIFGAGCIIASRQSGNYFWGRRYLAEILVRPVPHQVWPTKYEDFGIQSIEQNGGVAATGLAEVMGWSEVPGAAGAMVADLWVELSWLAIPACGLIGFGYGRCWRMAVTRSGYWSTQYVILALLSVYLVTQSMEAVIFRFIIISAPTLYVWRKAARPMAARATSSFRYLQANRPLVSPR